MESTCSPSELPQSTAPSSPPLPSIDLSSPHIPPLQSLINRNTLKELDLSAILRNPQLRHDLIFDAGLQFRPTSSRRKRELADRYWRAVTQEIESGCTCVSFDAEGRPCDCVCVCSRAPTPPTKPVLTYLSSRGVATLRMPSRVQSLLSEFLEVLLYVIQPLSSISGTYSQPGTFQAQVDQHAAQAAELRSAFDPKLIQQELRHQLFDPSGLFSLIGQTLKSHCAPMRDRAVDAMVAVAKSCAPGQGGTKADAVKAVRMCLDILELMKLDIANHQLQTLRPFLIDSSGPYELKIFQDRKGPASALDFTRTWLQTAHGKLMASNSINHPFKPSEPLVFDSLPYTQQVYLSVIKGFFDLVFDPPQVPSSTHIPHSAQPSHSTAPLPSYPETTYLDSARLLILANDASDAAALYLFLMLYRQLVFSSNQPSATGARDGSGLTEADMLQLKKEIRDISSSHLGVLLGNADTEGLSESERERRRKWRADIVLQIALRAKEAQSSKPGATCSTVPDESTLRLAERWTSTNMRSGSALSVMLKNKIRDAVFSHVLALTFFSRDSSRLLKRSDEPLVANVPPPSAGMEPLADEIASLSERLAKVASIHIAAYLPLYEQDGFLHSPSSPPPPSPTVSASSVPCTLSLDSSPAGCSA